MPRGTNDRHQPHPQHYRIKREANNPRRSKSPRSTRRAPSRERRPKRPLSSSRQGANRTNRPNQRMMMQHQHHPTNPPKPVTGAKDTFARGADYFNCRLMPHGGAVLFPVLLSTLGLCATLVDDGCDYARLRGAGVILLAGSASVPYVDCGISAYRIPDFYPAEKKWRVHYTGECMPYEHMDILADTSWVASEWLRFFALVIGATTALFLWTSTCLTLRPKHWLAAGIGALLTCIFQTCSFVWFYTKLCHTSAADFEDFESGREVETNQQETDAIAPSSCELFFGSKCAVTSCVLWAAASLMILLRKYPNPVPRFIVAEEDDAALKATIAPLNPSGARLRDSVSGRSGAKDSFTTGRSSVSFSVRKPGRDKSNLRNSEALTASMSTTGSRQQTPRSMGRGVIRSSVGRPGGNDRPSELSGSAFSQGSAVSGVSFV